MIIKIKKNTNLLFALYTSLLFSLYILPVLKYSIPYVVVATLIFLIMVYIYYKNKDIRNYILKIVFFASGMGLMFFFVQNQGDIISSINEIIRYVRFYIPLVILAYIFKKCNRTTAKIIFIICSMIIILIMFNTWIALIDDPMIARILAQGDVNNEYLTRYRMNNVGGFGFAYSMCFMSTSFICLSLNKRISLFKRIIFLLFFLISIGFIIMTQYTTLLLLSIAGALFAVYKNDKNLIKKLILIVMAVILYFSLDSLFNYLASKTDKIALQEKFFMLSNFASTGDIGVLNSRPERYFEAIKEFLNSPIYGNVQHIGGTVERAHSTIFGTLAGTGLIGLYFYISGVLLSYREMKNEYELKKIDTISFKINNILLFCLSLVNPIGYLFEVSFILFLFLPLMEYIFLGKDN